MARVRDFAAEYARRIAKGEREGRTHQASRGHVEHEHVLRRRREREAEGISGQERRSIADWYHRSFNPLNDKETSLAAIVDFARLGGFTLYQHYRDTWWTARRTYLRERRNGTYASRGMGHLEWLAEQAGAPDVTWLYYH